MAYPAPGATNVFISYRSEDSEAAEWLVERFTAAGLQVFGKLPINPAAPSGEPLRSALQQSAACLFLIGPSGPVILDDFDWAAIQEWRREAGGIFVTVLLPGALDAALDKLPQWMRKSWLDLRGGLDESAIVHSFIANFKNELRARWKHPREDALSAAPRSPAILEESIHLASASDQPTPKDSLGFEPYIDAVARFLASKDTRPPLTLSIEGEWGSGKSSFMLMLEEALRSESKPSCLTLRFNAWRHDKEDALWAAFALEFLRRIRRQRPLHARWLGDFRLFFSRYHWWEGWGELVRVAAVWTAFVVLASTLFLAFVENGPDLLSRVLDDKTGGLIGFLGRLGGGAGALAVIAVAFLKIKDLLGSPLEISLRKYLRSPDYQDHVTFVERFHEDFRSIVDAYAGERKVYVFIDDLDRCEIPKAADLMQALNLLIADDPRLIFVVGMDREKVAAGLAVKYEKLLPYLMTQDGFVAAEVAASESALEAATRRFGLEYGYTFLEKFIQLPFRVPAPQPDDLRRFLATISPDETTTGTGAGNGQVAAASADRRAPVAGDVMPPPARPQVGSEIAAARKERIRVKFGADSAAVRTVALMVAPALENNPRRLKQFVNLFRLKAYVANETGLFDELGGRAQLTFEQLAKFVAIGIAWPALLADLDEDPTLLARLEGSALGLPPPQDERALRWAGRRRLADLLRHGCKLENPEQESGYYSFADVNVDALLRVSPRVVRNFPSRPLTPAQNEIPVAPEAETTAPMSDSQEVDPTGALSEDVQGERDKGVRTQGVRGPENRTQLDRDSEIQPISSGTWLRLQRERRGFELRDIAERTKISLRYLDALENDRLDVLPAPVFARGFLLEYARYIGASPEEVLKRFEAVHGRLPKVPPRAEKLESDSLGSEEEVGLSAELSPARPTARRSRTSATASRPIKKE